MTNSCYWTQLSKDLQKKYPEIFSQITKVLYKEDEAKVFDTIGLALLDFDGICEFRFGRDDNYDQLDRYGNSRRSSENKGANCFDSCVYSSKTNVAYYFGFNHL